jgi:putative acetyltransferase
MNIKMDDLSGQQARELVRLHLQGMYELSPPEHVFALDQSGLERTDVTVWTAWDGDVVMGMGALRQHDVELGEIKSMRTHPNYLRKGVGAAILDHIISEARLRGLTRLSLETGSGPEFEPALALYHKRGFVNGAAFADYVASDFSQYLHLRIQ